jgi:hypothetical protein
MSWKVWTNDKTFSCEVGKKCERVRERTNQRGWDALCSLLTLSGQTTTMRRIIRMIPFFRSGTNKWIGKYLKLTFIYVRKRNPETQ